MFRLIECIKRWFKKPKDVEDRQALGAAYAVTTGTYVGEIFVYIREDEKHLHFISIPKLLNREVPHEKFQYAIDNNVIEYVETIPKNEQKMCKAQYEANEKS